MQIPLVIYTLALELSDDLEETIASIRNIKDLGYDFEHIVVLGSKLDRSECHQLLKQGCKLLEIAPEGIYRSLKSAITGCNPQHYVWVINPGDKPSQKNFPFLVDKMVQEFDGIKGITGCYLNGTYQYSFPKNVEDLQAKYYFHHQALLLRAHFYQNIDFEKFQISGDKYIYLKFEITNPSIFCTTETLATMNLGGVSQNGSREFTKFLEDTRIDLSTGNFLLKRFLLRIPKTFLKFIVFLTFGPAASANMMKFIMRKI